jgi:uncharacterized protein
MRLLCDEMLKGVGRWLRAAGYDVATVDDGAHDDDLLARAAAENRLLLTCDRRLAGRAAPDASVIVLRTERFDSAARELRERLGIDWLYAPFTRCLLDNAPLIPADEEGISELPATVREGDGPIMRCPSAIGSIGRAATCAGCWRSSPVHRPSGRGIELCGGSGFAHFVSMIRSEQLSSSRDLRHDAAGKPVKRLVRSGIRSSGDGAGGESLLQVRRRLQLAALLAGR